MLNTTNSTECEFKLSYKKIKVVKVLFFGFTISVFLFCSCHSGSSGEAYLFKMKLKKGDVFKEKVKIDLQFTAAKLLQYILKERLIQCQLP